MDAEAIKVKVYRVWYTLGIFLLLFILLTILSYLKHVVILLSVSILLAYVLTPMVRFFNRPIELHVKEHIRFSRWQFRLPLRKKNIMLHSKGFSLIISIIIVYLILLIIILLTVIYLVPIITEQFNLLIKNKDLFIEKGTGLYNKAYDWITPRIPPQLDQYLPEITTKIVDELRDFGINLLQHTIPMVTHLLSYVALIFIIPFVTFYILMDVEKYRSGFMALIPESKKAEYAALLHETDLMLGRYIRGQLIVCVVIGVSVTIALALLDIQYAVLIGVFAGIVDIIPYVGVAIGMIPAVLLALFKSPAHALVVLAVLYLIHWSEGHIIVPNVMGQSVGLPPLVVIVALIIGAETMGILGMFLAVPIASVIRVIVNHYIQNLAHQSSSMTDVPQCQ